MNINRLIVLFVLVLFSLGINLQAYAQLVINEVCSANFSNLADEDGDFEDWIEIYNTSNQPINLKDFTITDNADLPGKWTFPEILIESYDFIVLFASDKDRDLVINNFATAIFATDTFCYLNPTSEPVPEWRTIDFDDSDWMIGQGGFGFGEGSYNTLIPDTLMSVYLRKEFEITDKSNIVNALFHIDYDDGFIAFLNNHEIFRSNLRPDGKLPGYMQAAWKQHPAQMHLGGLPELYTINNEEIQRLLVDGENVLTIQLHNNWIDDEMSINPFLTFGLQSEEIDTLDTPDWFFNDDLHLHTSFKLASEGEELLLFDPDGDLMDEIVFPELMVNASYGRTLDSGEEFAYFVNPSPGGSNNEVENFSGVVTEFPQISLDAGIYNLETGDSLFIEIMAPDTGFLIRYTLDGNDPVDTSDLYVEGLFLSETKVLKTRLFKDGLIPGKISTNSYIINKTTNLPIISISTVPNQLWDYENGIYVKGPNASTSYPYFGANFWRDIEIPAHIEYFGTHEQVVFEQGAGIKIHGGWSRAFDQKSLRLTARSCFGQSEFENQFFPDKNIHNFKKVILRNGGNDFQAAMLRDPLMHKMIQKATNLAVQDYLPTVVYLNGEYWGIHNMREKIDGFFLRDNFDLDDRNVDLLEKNDIVISGDNKDFLELYDYILNQDLSEEVHFETVSDRIDISNLIDYFIVELFIVNTDWPQNNVKYWKHEDSRWQYIFLDADNSMGLMGSIQHYSKNAYTRVLADSVNMHPIIFQQLLENNTFKHQFINRYADLLNTIFKTENSIALIDTFKDSLIVEMEHHRNKWGGSVSSWANYHIDTKLKTFFEKRPEFAREHTIEIFGLDTIFNLCVKTENGLGSRIKVNSIIPDQFPWNGIYFDSIPISLEALPAPGMEFSHWQTSDFIILPDVEEQMWWHLSKDDTIIAHFSGLPDTSKLMVTEVNFESHKNRDAADWVEIYNPNSESMDISGWKLKSDNDFKFFTFPENTLIQASEYLVVVRDSLRFAEIYPEVENFVGSFDFGLKKYAAKIRLFDPYENEIVDFTYSTELPWPQDIAGSGRTIELVNLEGEMNNPLNWIASCLGGSPGEASVICHEDFKIAFTEFNYSSHPNFDTKDWVEIYNYDTIAVDLSNWIFKDSDGAHEFILPYGLHLEPNGFLVICKDTNDFQKFNPGISEIHGNFDFGLSSMGDKIRLYDPYENLISELEFTTESPWPQNVNGTGRTAEVIDYTLDLNDGLNWTQSCLGGSPGMLSSMPCNDTASLIVTEINYSSVNEFDTGDWFEIFNFGDEAILMNGWTFRDANTNHNFEFPDDVILYPGEYLVVVEDSLQFLSVHDTIPQFVGEFGFGLSNEADEIHLTDLFGQEIVFISYQTTPPWPENTLEPGKTLELINYNEPQNNPENWKVGCVLGSPGMPYFDCENYSISENVGDLFSIKVHPNPFHNNFVVELSSKKKVDLKIEIKNVQGREVDVIYSGNINPGKNTLNFDDLNLEKGVYFLQLSSSDFIYSYKLVCY